MINFITVKASRSSHAKVCGFTLVEALVATSITAATLSLTLYGFSRVTELKSQIKIIDSAIQFRDSLVVNLTESSALSNTFSNNPTFACLVNQTDCKGKIDNTDKFNIYNNSGEVEYAAADDNIGFTSGGAICSGYLVDKACSYRISASWTPLCEVNLTECKDPLVQIRLSIDSGDSVLPLKLYKHKDIVLLRNYVQE